MSLTFKLASLAIRTVAKPIGNQIKKQASEHDGFRRLCINGAQRLHRIDMRMRLGILHDTAAQERMHAREERKAEEKRRAAETPTVLTEAQLKARDAEWDKSQQGNGEKKEESHKPHKVKIRPLSEGKAIELGANFFSEAFIFAVAAGLLIFDSWRARRKESARRDDVAERLDDLETEVDRLRTRYEPELVALEKKRELEEERKEALERKSAWWNPVGWFRQDPEPVADDSTLLKEAQTEVKRTREVAEVANAARVKRNSADEKESKSKGDSKDMKNETEVPKSKKEAQESRLETHDICIPLNPTIDSRTGQTTSSDQLRVLLLSPSAVTENAATNSISRIRHFASLTGGKDLIIIFLLAPTQPPPSSFVTAKQVAHDNDPHQTGLAGIHAFTQLQVLIHNDQEIPHIPTLPLAKLEGLADLLSKHATAMAARYSRAKRQPAPATAPFELLKLCTADPPMSQEHAYVLSDIFPRLRDLAVACTSVTPETEAGFFSADSREMQGSSMVSGGGPGVEGRLEDLRVLLGEQAYRNVVDFWGAEWTID
ncbi:hypothetical protein MBLNU230_g3812t1 [Neophaeotheca triangularis]